MDEIRFSDWPDPPGSNAWLPAYGFQQNDIMEKEDFFGTSCDAGSNQALYLETIVEETSDDLRSEKSSTSTWLSDSDADSVIHVGPGGSECDSGSEREFACPAKRRRRNHDSDDSLSRSSSLAQFESLERSCAALSISPDSLDSPDLSDSSARTVRPTVPPPTDRPHLSAENLSEDSGYSELRGRCKSDPSVRDEESRQPPPPPPRARTEIACRRGGGAGGSDPCIASNQRATHAARALSVPANLDLCTDTKPRVRRNLTYEQCFTQTFKVCESLTTSVADLTALDYRGNAARQSGGRARRPLQPPPPPPPQARLTPQRESSSGSDSTTESEKAFALEMETTVRRLDEAARLALCSETSYDRDVSILTNRRVDEASWGAWDDVLDELRRRHPPSTSSESNASSSECTPQSEQRIDQIYTSTPVRKADERVRSTPELRSSLVRSVVTPDDLRTSLQHVAASEAQPPSRSVSTGSKGVTFSPVVAEVSWREISSSEEGEGAHSDSSSVDSRDAEVEVIEEGGAINTDSVDRRTLRAAAMQDAGARAHSRSRIAGFLSRFANFRFSSRKNEKKARGACVVKSVPKGAVSLPQANDVQSVRIPLKAPVVQESAVATCARPAGPPGPGVLETDVDAGRTVIHARSLLTLGPHQNTDRRPHKSMEFLLDKENARVVQPPENDLQKNSDRVLSEHELRVQRSLQKLNVPEWYKNAPTRDTYLHRKRLSDVSANANRWATLGSKTTSLSSLGYQGAPLTTPNHNTSQLSPATTSFSRWSTSRLNSNQTSPCSSTRSSLRCTTLSPVSPSPSARSSFSARQPYLGWRASQEQLLAGGTPRTPHERLASSLLAQQKASEEIRKVQSSIKEVTSAIVHYVSGLEPGNSAENDDAQPSPRGSQKLWVESSFVGTKPLETPQTPTTVSGLPPVHPRPPSSLALHRQPVTTTPDWHTQKPVLITTVTRPSPGSTTLEDVLDSLLGLPSSMHQRVASPQISPRKGSGSYFLLNNKGPRYEQLSGHSNSSLASKNNLSTPSEDGQLSSFKSLTFSHTSDVSDLRRSSQDSLPSGKPSVDRKIVLTDMHGSHRARPRSASRAEHSRRGSEPFSLLKASSLDRRTSLDVPKLQPDYSSLTIFKESLQERAESKTSLHSVVSMNTDNSGDEVTVKCKNSKCQAKTSVAEAKRHYKNCHNCNYMYCSSECRRAHWDKHRKACLHSRASTLCKQILSTAKEDSQSLQLLSTTAYQGYLHQGRGLVKLTFTSPDAADKFIAHGFQFMTEPMFTKWENLQPNEMGVELYAEVVKMCKIYNPESKLLLFVAVCILSEVPAKGAVKWERQMVSRCAKIRLSKTVSASIKSHNDSRSGKQRRGSRNEKERTTSNELESLVLVGKYKQNETNRYRKFKENCFLNIQRELESRGVILKKHFPEVHGKLISYVDSTADKFKPITLYPKNTATGKEFICIIVIDNELGQAEQLEYNGKVTSVDISVDHSNKHLATKM